MLHVYCDIDMLIKRVDTEGAVFMKPAESKGPPH